MSTATERPVVVMTLMVRDEIDIIRTWLEYHLNQDLDRIIVTDNASADGTYELLREYADDGRIELRTYERHDKRQFEVVTRMARDAFTEHGADWVLNSDADEFWLAPDGQSVGEMVRRLPAEGRSYPVPVVNMFSTPLASGFDPRLAVYRDEREPDDLERVGLHAHPTHNLVHPGSVEVEMAQGNHFSNLPQAEALPEGVALEVHHFPMRSWAQYRARVESTGRAYAQSPDLFPSPRHHGMRDYRWLRAGVLEPFFVARHPDPADLQRGFREDRGLAERLAQTLPELSTPDVELLDEAGAQRERHAMLGPLIVRLDELRTEEAVAERERFERTSERAAQLELHNGLQHERIAALETRNTELESDADRTRRGMEQLRARMRSCNSERDALRAQLDKYEQNPLLRPVRAAVRIGRSALRRIRGR